MKYVCVVKFQLICRRKFSSVFKMIIFKYHKDDPFEVNAVIVNKLSVCNLPTN